MFVAASSLCGCGRDEPTSIEYVPTPGEASTICFEVDDSGARKIAVEFWPTEIYFGDPVYVAAIDQNASDSPIYYFGAHRDRRFEDCIIASFPSISYEYFWSIPRAPWNVKNYIPDQTVLTVLKPNGKHLNTRLRLEFPPLQSMDDPFWKAFEEAMPPEGLTCRLAVVVDYRDSDNKDFKKTLTQDIHIKPRPREERELLAKWFKETKSKLPTRDADGALSPSDYPSEFDIDAHGADDIRIGWSKYNPWVFIPYGYRQPSIPNCPTTIEGWRELESSLAPSTMRDEIRLVRLQLEYYAASKGEATEKAKEELLAWLDGRPVAQRATMVYGLFKLPMPKYAEAKLGAKRRALLEALRDRAHSDDFLK